MTSWTNKRASIGKKSYHHEKDEKYTKNKHHCDVERKSDSARDTALVAAKYQNRSNYKIAANYHTKTKINIDKSADITADNILPGASTLEDINMYINTAKKEKLEQLKKKLPTHR